LYAFSQQVIDMAALTALTVEEQAASEFARNPFGVLDERAVMAVAA